MSRRKRPAFTLVELLVVIAIIGMLVALLMPALMAARGRSRAALCTDYQHEICAALLQYESAKQPARFPGYNNNVGGSARVGWVPVIFPFLGRNDLWEGASGWRTGSGQTQKVDQLICPADRPTNTAGLSYVANGNIIRDVSGTPPVTVSLTNVRSASVTPLVAEAPAGTRVWTAADTTTTFGSPTWPSGTIGATAPCVPLLHGSVLIMGFCDGHVASVADNVNWSVYTAGP